MGYLCFTHNSQIVYLGAIFKVQVHNKNVTTLELFTKIWFFIRLEYTLLLTVKVAVLQFTTSSTTMDQDHITVSDSKVFVVRLFARVGWQQCLPDTMQVLHVQNTIYLIPGSKDFPLHSQAKIKSSQDKEMLNI